MGKSRNLGTQLLDEINAGLHGASGSVFPTVREVVDRYSVSYVTAQKALQGLREEGWLYALGNHSYLATGAVQKHTPLARALKRLKTEVELLKNEIKLSLMNRESGESEGYIVTWKSYTIQRFDSKRFMEEHPGMYRSYVNVTEARRFSVKEK